MPSKVTKRLVIDTSVTSAAGGEKATHPTPKQCRECLLAVRKNGHFFVISDEIWEEWKRHRSTFASEWLTSMRARKLIYRIGDATDVDLRAKIARHSENDETKEEMLKDTHLLEAALATDKLIISLNEVDRKSFQAVAHKIGEIRALIWVNPVIDDEQCPIWLQNGCPAEKHRLLGYTETE